MGKSEEIRNEIKSAKSMMENNLVVQAKDIIYQCIKKNSKSDIRRFFIIINRQLFMSFYISNWLLQLISII